MQPLQLRLSSPSSSQALEEARADVLALQLPAGERAFVRYAAPSWPPGLSWLADMVLLEAQRQLDVEPAREALLSWNAYLQLHRDRTAPYPCVNALVILRRACAGGHLRLRGAEYACEDADLLLFDGQDPHEVTPVEALAAGGYRASLLFYLQRPGSE